MSRARGPSPDPREELAELQKKFNLLEGDRKAYFEASQWTIRQNKETVEIIKKENKELREALAQLQQERARGGGGGSITAEIEKVQGQISTLRRKYNELKHANNVKGKEIQVKRDELHDHEVTVEGEQQEQASENPTNRKIRQLENKLEKQNLKYQEGLMFKKTYETMLQRLKAEQVELENQLIIAQRDFEMREEQNESLEAMMREAIYEREKAKSDLETAKAKLSQEREIRKKELHDRERLVDARTKVNEKVEERLRQRQEIQLEAAGDLSAEQEAHLKNDLTAQQLQQKVSEQKIIEAEQKAEKYEDAFKRIKEATGVDDVNVVIDKFLGQDAQRTNLTEQLRELQKRVDSLNEEKEKSRQLLDELKYSGSGNLASRKILDEFDNQLSATTKKVDELKRKHEMLSTTVLRSKLGLENLVDRLDTVKTETASLAAEEDLEDILAFVESKVDRLAEATAVPKSEDDHLGGDAASHIVETVPARSPGKASKSLGPDDVVLSEHNVRIPLEALESMDLESEGQQTDRLIVDEDEDDDIPDRQALKERSALQVTKGSVTDRKKRSKKPQETPKKQPTNLKKGKQG